MPNRMKVRRFPIVEKKNSTQRVCHAADNYPQETFSCQALRLKHATRRGQPAEHQVQPDGDALDSMCKKQLGHETSDRNRPHNS